ncbi:olfactory receptor 7E24-like [Gorilla gorilla gorilla]|uniref:olfactory receptor 7E24-like n=1 Tax=Gorilla gorilla gorilla TaxID=9595 RepID=UPI003008B2C7
MSSPANLDVNNEITEGVYTPCDIGSNMILSPPGYWERYHSAEDPELQLVLALLSLSLSMYMVTVLRNLLSILAVRSDSPLHSPMCFFLSILCWADIGFTSATVPKMIVDMQSHSRVISYEGCLTRMSFLVLFACMEDMLLTVMAYDCFVAISRPLHYPVIVNPLLCVFFILVSFFLSPLDSQLHSWFVLLFTIIKNVEITNFVCDPSQLLNLACSDSVINNIFIYFDSTMFGFLPISGILLSYYKIVPSILRMSSSDGKYKGFSTCGSHLAVAC